MDPFAYNRPATIEEAIALRRRVPDAIFLAGGMTLIPDLRQGRTQTSHVIDIGWLETLKHLHVSGTTVDVGALVTHDRLATTAGVIRNMPALAWLASQVGDPQVRNRGTIAGAVAAPHPAGDYPAALLALDARIHTDRRTIPANGFFIGPNRTALEPDELIIRVSFPVPDQAGYARFAEHASQYPLVGVFVAKRPKGVRVAVIGAGPTVLRARAMETSLEIRFNADALDGVTIRPHGFRKTMHGSAAYRAHLITVMAKRAVAGAR